MTGVAMVVSVRPMVNFAKLVKWMLNATHFIQRHHSAMLIWDVVCEPGSNTGCTQAAPVCDAETRRCVPCEGDKECSLDGSAFAVRAHAWLAATMRIVATACAPIFRARLSAPSAIQADRSRRMAAANMNRIALALVAVVLACIMTIAQHGIRCVTSTGTHVVSARADSECSEQGLLCFGGQCRVCDPNRDAPDLDGVDLGCTVEAPDCAFGGTRCI